MKPRLRKITVRIFWIAICVAVFAFLPVEDKLPHPQKAVLTYEHGINVPVQLAVYWYDLGLNKKRFHKLLDFGPESSVQLPDAPVSTYLWRLILKRSLQPFDKWTACENCDGPSVSYWLRTKDDFKVEDKMRLVQNRTETNEVISFVVSIIPDELKHETREFITTNVDELITQARVLISDGDQNNIPAFKWCSSLSKINPVRVECRNSVLILWMGGKIAYVIAPDSTSCPAFNMAFISGTEHPHVFKMEKM